MRYEPLNGLCASSLSNSDSLAVRQAVQAAGFSNGTTSHAFQHSFAKHLQKAEHSGVCFCKKRS
jgi:hypothetical protein